MTPSSAAPTTLPETHQSFKYRPEIDGLRALAVVSVVLYHAGLSFPGGYVGVDVFFVISGYLITSLIIKDLDANRFTLADFWERRIRRIFPALFVTIFASFGLGLLIMPHDFKALGSTMVFQPMALVNLYFWRTTGYFSAADDTKPLLHTWSLAVEEQFYLLLPFGLLLLFRFPWARTRTFLISILSLVALISLAIAVHYLPSKPNSVFFLLPTRIWELLAGSLVALICPLVVPGSKWVRETLSWAGLAGIIWSIVVYRDGTPFPGLAAMPSVLGASLFIFANTLDRRSGVSLTTAGKLFASPPLVFIGLISYSLYLWHWPLLVFGRYWFAGLHYVPGWMTGLLLALTAIVSVLSWRFVEIPFRKKRIAGSRRGIFIFALAGSIFSMGMGGAVFFSNGFATRLPIVVRSNSLAAEEIPQIEPGFPFGDLSQSNVPRVVMWGDSHAKCVSIALDALCREEKVPCIYLDSSITSPRQLVEYVREHRIPHAVLSQYWHSHNTQSGPAHYTVIENLILELDQAGCKVWFLLDVPDMDVLPVRVLSREVLFGWPKGFWNRTVSDHRARNAGAILLQEKGLPATFVDLASPLIDSTGKFYRYDDGGVSLYYDDDHFTRTASMKYTLPALRNAMSGRLGLPGS